MPARSYKDLSPEAAADSDSTSGFLSSIDSGAVEAVERFLRIVATAVPYESCFDGEPRLDVTTYLKMRTLAIVECFFCPDDAKLLSVLNLTEEAMRELRAHPRWDEIKGRFLEAGQAAGQKQGVQKLIESAETQLGQELLLAALEPVGPRGRPAKNQALAMALDRVSSKAGRRRDGAKLIVNLPPNLAANIEFGLRMTLREGAEPAMLPAAPDWSDADDSVIDAEVLNVPIGQKRLGGNPGDD